MKLMNLSHLAVRLIEDRLLSVGIERKTWAEMVAYWLKTAPASTLLLAVVDNDRCLAHVLATADDGMDRVIVHEYRADDDTPPGMIRRMWIRLCMWAEDHGRAAIQSDTQRMQGPLIAKFAPTATIIECTIGSVLGEEPSNELSTGPIRGDSQPGSDGEHRDAGPAADSAGDWPVSAGPDGDSGGSVSG